MKVEAIDHVHICIPDLERAKGLFGALMGGTFSEVYGGGEANAWGVFNSLGLDVIQPIRDNEPVFGKSTTIRKGIVGMSFRVRDLDSKIPEVEAMGLRLVSRISSEDVGYGKVIVQAQFDPSDSFGSTYEIAERLLPDDPLFSPFRSILDHIDLYVRNLDRATRLYSDLTGFGFSEPVAVDDIRAKTSDNPLGFQITQPISPDSPIARTIDEYGEGPHVIAFRTSHLEDGIAKAQGAGLRLVRQTDGEDGTRRADFDPRDSFGITVRFVERSDG